MDAIPFVTIIIPTFNHAKTLQTTLDSQLNQTYPAEHYEIIVSDNNSTDSTPDIVDRYIKTYPGRIRVLREHRQGVHYARNSAAKIAHGDILYFTDDDMIADKDLLKELVKIFSFDPRIASTTGRVLPQWEVNPPSWIIKLCSNGLLSLNNPPEEFVISTQDCNIFSCHQGVLKNVFIQSGGFNPENTAGEWIGDGETGLNINIKELGYKFAYNGACITHHVIPAGRMTQKYLNRRLANQGNCDSYTEYRKYKYSNAGLLQRIAEHFVHLMFFEIVALITFVIGRITWHIHQARVFYFLNRIRYDFRLIVDEQWRAFVLKRDWLSE
jgi:glycosyltransferase involved in cell wall biosynthesis